MSDCVHEWLSLCPWVTIHVSMSDYPCVPWVTPCVHEWLSMSMSDYPCVHEWLSLSMSDSMSDYPCVYEWLSLSMSDYPCVHEWLSMCPWVTIHVSMNDYTCVHEWLSLFIVKFHPCGHHLPLWDVFHLTISRYIKPINLQRWAFHYKSWQPLTTMPAVITGRLTSTSPKYFSSWSTRRCIAITTMAQYTHIPAAKSDP